MAFIEGQTLEDFSSQIRHIQGVVIDPEESPIIQARIDESGAPSGAHQTDSAGRFERYESRNSGCSEAWIS